MRNISLVTILLCLALTGCKGERSDTQLVQRLVDPAVEPDEFLTFLNQKPELDSVAYASRYYDTVDPLNERTTLNDWKTATGFGMTPVTHATFRDAKDLGYGRDMFAWENAAGDIMVFVDNYVVELQPGDASSYGPLNLDAAINQDRRYLIGTNAIEFSAGPDGERIAKFFTFAVEDASGIQHRQVALDMDGRGVKGMPTPCVVCHGGTMYPLTKNGDFHPTSLKSPKMHIIEQNSAEFSPVAGFTEADQAPAIKEINRLILKSYIEAAVRQDVNGTTRTASDPQGSNTFVPGDDDRANWDSTFAEELVNTAYQGDVTNANTVHDGNAVPSGWTQTPARPNGVETLYRQVIGPHCIGCHSLRGTKIGQGLENTASGLFPNATTFRSYENFIADKDLIIEYTYRLGNMPRSLINYDKFWKDPDGAPTLLASFLDPTGAIIPDASGKVVAPGKPVALPGADRTVPSGTVLDATASEYTSSYAWTINALTNPAANATLDDPTSPAPVLTAVHGFDVILDLVTSNSNGDSDVTSVTITINDMVMPDVPTNLTFEPHINQILRNSCVSCHNPTTGNTGIPVYFDNTLQPDLYNEVLARIDLEHPENSLLLRKATSSTTHGGGLSPLSTTDQDYNTILNWIRNGAPCGLDLTYC